MVSCAVHSCFLPVTSGADRLAPSAEHREFRSNASICRLKARNEWKKGWWQNEGWVSNDRRELGQVMSPSTVEVLVSELQDASRFLSFRSEVIPWRGQDVGNVRKFHPTRNRHAVGFGTQPERK